MTKLKKIQADFDFLNKKKHCVKNNRFKIYSGIFLFSCASIGYYSYSEIKKNNTHSINSRNPYPAVASEFSGNIPLEAQEKKKELDEHKTVNDKNLIALNSVFNYNNKKEDYKDTNKFHSDFKFYIKQLDKQNFSLAENTGSKNIKTNISSEIIFSREVSPTEVFKRKENYNTKFFSIIVKKEIDYKNSKLKNKPNFYYNQHYIITMESQEIMKVDIIDIEQNKTNISSLWRS